MPATADTLRTEWLLSHFSLTAIVAAERNDSGVLAMPIETVPVMKKARRVCRANLFQGVSGWVLPVNSFRRNYGIDTFEYIKIKTILNWTIRNFAKHDDTPVRIPEEAEQHHRAYRISIAAWWLHQRKHFIDGLQCRLADTIGILHAGDVDAANHGFDLVAIVGEEAKRIGRFIGHTRNQSCDQNLAGNHPPVQLIHVSLQIRYVVTKGSVTAATI
jgi:hypothetical protein